MYSIGATTVQVLILELEEKDIRPDLVQIRNWLIFNPRTIAG
jgi:hypothetical protein